MKVNFFSRPPKGYTLVELMIVVAILSILFSIIQPRIDLLLQKAQQSTAKNNLGSIRSAIGLYYSDNEGHTPLTGIPDGFPDSLGLSLSIALCPTYMQTLPTPKLLDRAGDFNGTGLMYDEQAKVSMNATPVLDVLVLRGPAGPTPGINRPFVYDPDANLLYICNDNYDTTGNNFYNW
jgi:prepilin-type N-terminal cleavage/methylation domain-containing protein